MAACKGFSRKQLIVIQNGELYKATSMFTTKVIFLAALSIKDALIVRSVIVISKTMASKKRHSSTKLRENKVLGRYEGIIHLNARTQLIAGAVIVVR